MKKINLRQFSKILGSSFIGLILTPQLSYASKKKAKEDDGEKAGALANPLSVEVQGVVSPVVRGNKLVNYAFMTLLVYAKDNKSADIIRANQYLVKDAIARETSKNPIPEYNPANTFDKAIFAQRIAPVIAKSLIGVSIRKVEITSSQMMRN